MAFDFRNRHFIVLRGSQQVAAVRDQSQNGVSTERLLCAVPLRLLTGKPKIVFLLHSHCDADILSWSTAAKCELRV